MPELVSLSEQLTDVEWLSEMESIGRERGYSEWIDQHHFALFLDESLDTLLVCFDTLATARTGSASGIPHGMLQAEINGWSHLSIIADHPTWFRSEGMFAYFDRLVDDAFFDDFSTVIFYGSGLCGYAAAAYSVAAPGAHVILAAPQATLDPAVAPWDDRFSEQRRRDFRSRYGFAPDMIEAAGSVHVLYDPVDELDAMHAALFRGPHVHHHRMRHFGTRIGQALQSMNLLGPLFRAASEGTLGSDIVHRLLRRRREYLPYLRNLLGRVHVEERHFLTAILCRAVLERKNTQRFRHHLELAEHKLTDQGKSLPRPHRKRRGASSLPRLTESD